MKRSELESKVKISKVVKNFWGYLWRFHFATFTAFRKFGEENKNAKSLILLPVLGAYGNIYFVAGIYNQLNKVHPYLAFGYAGVWCASNLVSVGYEIWRAFSSEDSF